MNNISVGEIAQWIGGEVSDRWRGAAFGPISTDSRTIGKGDFFLALKGENFDGHFFCPRAVERGAAGLIIQPGNFTQFDAHLPVLRVDDTLRAYGEIARRQRGTWGGPALAISGSVGKTTTRRLMAQAIGAHRKVLEPIKNFNNLIGVPQTLLQLTAAHEVAVLELGMNQPGELDRLTEIAQPTVAGLTRIGLTHVGMFKSLDELIEAKLALFAGTKAGTPLVINAACGNSRRAIERFSGGHPLVSFRSEGSAAADYYVENISPISNEIGYRFDLVIPSGAWRGARMLHFGRHHLEDVACAAAMLGAAGLNPEWVLEAAENFETEAYRGQVLRIGSWTFILDCYNASPDSMRASLQSLGELRGNGGPGGRLILVLADMLELGTHSRPAHEAMLEYIRPLNPSVVYGLGPESSRLADLLKGEGIEAIGFSDSKALGLALRANLSGGDWVFFKGSHGFALEKIAQAVAPEAKIL
ncbi:UDP-N-acetylmuramoyl-tripeptide--D-alanyl-D-alanine ligase, partial [Candidatus Sumerlaeota bacterium]|nr:UDP-N-acetylmuramoyl-tripeptide--D-alanyl-D-alanine ligase [Candidatus Sumerlaeota bacterium]